MSRNHEDYFKISTSAKADETVRIPGSRIWCKELKITKESNRRIIPIPDGWIVGIKIGTSAPIFIPDTDVYLEPKKSTLEEGLSITFLRQRGRIRCGVPYTEVILKDNYGFGFAGYLGLKLQYRSTFYDEFASEKVELRDFQLADQHIRKLMISCIKAEFAEFDSRQIASGAFNLDIKIRNAINQTTRENNLPSKLGLIVEDIVLESKKVARLETKS